MMEYYRKGRCHTLGDSRYILTEYTHGTEYSYIAQMTQEALRNGYIPIIAHAERYGCMVEKIQRAEELRDMGAWIQNNADAVLGLEGRGPKKYCKKLLKEIDAVVVPGGFGVRGIEGKLNVIRYARENNLPVSKENRNFVLSK